MGQLSPLQSLFLNLGLTTIPQHTSQLLSALLSYTTLFTLLSPTLSPYLAPCLYPSLPRRTRINWDIRVVSFIQALFICGAALHVIATDDDRAALDGNGRLWSYSASSGRVQAFAAGYFVWDLVVSLRYIQMLGPGSLVHAVAALAITMMGFRPFANFYGINFILYELSTPFLNIHWFLDKAGMTGSTLQLVNGVCLMASFFACRIVWGWYQSINIYRDAWAAWSVSERGAEHSNLSWGFVGTFIAANTLLCVLNVYWFGLMVKAMRKRFS